MDYFIIKSGTRILPFWDEARDLPVGNTRLIQYQHNLIGEVEIIGKYHSVDSIDDVNLKSEKLVFPDNLYLTKKLLIEFINKSKNEPCTQLAIKKSDPFLDENTPNAPITTLSSLEENHNFYLFPLFYSTQEKIKDPTPIVISTNATLENFGFFPLEIFPFPDGRFLIPFTDKLVIPINNWMAYALANIYSNIERVVELRKQTDQPFTEKSRIGKNCKIGANSIMIGSVIGDNCIISPGAVMIYSRLGNNSSLQSRAIAEFSTIGNQTLIDKTVTLHGCTIMDDCVMGTGCLYKFGSVVGKKTFIGGISAAGSLLMKQPEKDGKIRAIETLHEGAYKETGTYLWGGVVGHNARLGAGVFLRAGMMIGNGTIHKFMSRVSKNFGKDIQPTRKKSRNELK